MKRKLLILIMMLFCLCGCKEKVYKDTPDDVTINITSSVEVYSKKHLYDLINIDNAKIENENVLVETEKLGKQTIKIYYRYEKKKHVYDFDFVVNDTTAPKIFANASKTIAINYTDDICNLIMYGDNYDKKPACVVEGTYDFSKPGTYPLKYIVTDSSNNKSEHNLNLTIVTKLNTNTSTTKKLLFSDVINNYKNDKTEIGIDVSKWQGDIDFNKVKNAGATFVMMRIGFQKSINGEIEMDPYYLQNIEKAKNAGLKVGVYLYSMAASKEEGIAHAKWIISKLNGIKLELPITFDWENWSTWNNFNLSFYDINNVSDAFIKTVKDNGYDGMLYSSKFYLENIWENKNNDMVWLAHYTSNTTYQGDYIMWQLSNIGKIDGINGDVDINILYHS